MICKGINSNIIPIEEKIPDFDKLSGRQKINVLRKLNCTSKKNIMKGLGI